MIVNDCDCVTINFESFALLLIQSWLRQGVVGIQVLSNGLRLKCSYEKMVFFWRLRWSWTAGYERIVCFVLKLNYSGKKRNRLNKRDLVKEAAAELWSILLMLIVDSGICVSCQQKSISSVDYAKFDFDTLLYHRYKCLFTWCS